MAEITWDDAADSTPQSGIQWDEGPSLLDKGKELGKAMLGGAEAGAEVLPKMAAGAAGMATGALFETARSLGEGELPTNDKLMEAGGEFAHKFTDWRFMEEARPVEEKFNQLFDEAIQGLGRGTEQLFRATGGRFMPEKAREAIAPVVRGGAEVGAQMLPVERGAAAVRDVFRSSAEPTGVDPIKGYGPAYDPSKPIDYVAGPKADIVKSGEFDSTLTNTDVPTIEPDKTGAYTYKNKEVIQKLDQWDYRKASDMSGIDFTNFSIEDPKQLESLQKHLDELGIKSNINEARLLAKEMEDKIGVAEERAKGLAHTISKRIPPMAIPEETAIAGYKRINASPMNDFVELVDTRLMELMRDHDRLTEPKGLNQFMEKENSVLNAGVHKGLTLLYWPEDGRIVQSNGNTRRGVAAKHGLMEIPAYVRVMEGKVSEEWQKTAVSIPGLKWEGSKPQGQFAKPSDIGLPSRMLNEGIFDPRIKYAPEPTVTPSVKLPDGSFQNNHLFSIQHNELPQWGARKGLAVIRDTSSIPWYRAVSKLLLDDREFNPNFQIREKNDPSYLKHPTQIGQYRPRDYEMSVRKDMAGNEYIFMHEAIHAKTHSVIQKLLDGTLDRMHPSYDAAKRLTELWQNLSIDAEIKTGSTYESIKMSGVPIDSSQSPLTQIIGQYGLKDVHEFIAEAFTKPEFQNLLKQISLPDHLQPKKGFEYYWDAFVKALGDLIGISRDQNNYLAATLQAGTELMRTSTKQDRMFYALEQKPESWYPRAVGVESRDPIKNITEMKMLLSVDRRSIPDVVRDTGLTKDNIKDLDNGDTGTLRERLWGTTKLWGRNLADARTVQMLNTTVQGAGDLLHNIGSRVFLADRWSKAQIEETMKGKEFQTGFTGRFEHRLGSRDGIDPTIKSLSTSNGEEMLKRWLPRIGREDLVRSDFANDKQWNAFNVINNQLQRGLGIVNDLRLKKGLPFIEGVKNFFPASRGRGDYKVVMKDSMENIRDVSLFENIYDAEAHVKEMREKFPYMSVDDPFHREPYKIGETDYSVWAEAERINAQDNELSKLIQQAKVEKFTRYGMGGHLLKRKVDEAIGGYLGSDFNIQNAREGLQQYFEYLYNYAGNLSKGLIEDELNALRLQGKDGKDVPLSEAAPNLDSYLHQFLAKAKGAANVYDQSENIFFGQLSKALGHGASAPQRSMASVSRLAMVWYLFKTSFFATQPIQTFNALPHLVDMTGSVTKASQHFLEGWSRAILPTDADRSVVNWAVREGHIDPTTSHLMDEYNTNIITRAFLKTTGTIERELVRIPALLMYEHALRDTIKDTQQRYAAAAEKMAYSMSMTNKSNSPLVWEKLGIVGQGMRQLKSYSTNIWGQFAYFMQQAGEAHSYKPLATFLGTEALIGGIKGVIGIAEATAAITAFNALTNSNVDTPVEWLLKKGAPDSLMYGLASTVTGRDVSNQVGNPSGFNYFDPIPFKFAADIVMANAKYAIAVAQDQLNDDVRLETWLANTPPAAHEAIKHWFNKPGQPVPTPGMGGRGRYFRDEQAKRISSVTSTKSVEEAKADDAQRFFKMHEQRLVANKSAVQNSMVDDIMNGQGLNQSKIQAYVRQGGDLRNLGNDLKQTMIERHRSDIFNKIVSKAKTPSHATAIKEAQPYLQNQPSNIYPGGQSGTIEWDK